jgi:hypothetical protein
MSDDFEVQPSSSVPAIKITKPNESTKIATPDLILLKEEALPVDTMSDLIFDDIGGQEIINVSRNDLINGVNSYYQLLSDIENTSNQYNSSTLIPLPGQSSFYLQNYAISLEKHIPYNDLSLSKYILTKTVSSTNDTKITTIKKVYIQIINAQPQQDQYGAYTGKVVYTTIEDHGLSTGDTVTVSNILPASYNVSGTVTVLSKDTFTITNSTTDDFIPPTSSVYFESYGGDLIIEVDNMLDDEQVEVEIISSSTIFDDTMYIIGEQ